MATRNYLRVEIARYVGFERMEASDVRVDLPDVPSTTTLDGTELPAEATWRWAFGSVAPKILADARERMDEAAQIIVNEIEEDAEDTIEDAADRSPTVIP